MGVRGYKAFNMDMTCTKGKGVYQYEIGKTYEQSGLAEARRTGFHFCLCLEDVFRFYHKGNCRVCEVVALGDIEGDGEAYSTNKIQIVKEICYE